MWREMWRQLYTSTRPIPPPTLLSFQLELYVILVPGDPIQPNSAFQLK